MIFDKIENQGIYKSIHPSFEKAFDFLNSTDLENAELGKHIIDGDNVFAIIMEYTTQEESECKSETHKKYIDIQYMVEGEELVGLKTLHDEIPTTPYNKEGDFMFYTLPSLPKLILKKQHFGIFFPDDIHLTMLKVDVPKKLRKVVIKVLKNI
jgi:YhcH/YjgK/YiaL family protein